MIARAKSLLATVSAVAIVLGMSTTTQPAHAATSAETLFSKLAALPEAERMKQLIAGAKKEGQVVIVPSYRGKLMVTHTKLFMKRYPWLKVDFADMNTEAAAERLIAEETAGRHITDTIGVTIPDMVHLLKRNLAANYPTPATKTILPRYKKFIDQKNRWTPWYWSEHGISYNTKIIKEADAPKTYQDLCNPKYKGQVSFDPGEPKWLIGMYLLFGEEKFKEWLQCIGKNDPVIQRGHTLRMTLMLAGDHAIQGDNFLYRGVLARAKNPKKAPFQAVWTAPILARAGVNVINPHATHPNGAALWTDWLLSDQSQKFVHSIFRGPLAIKHPYIKDETELFVYGLVPFEVTQKVSDYWVRYVGKNR